VNTLLGNARLSKTPPFSPDRPPLGTAHDPKGNQDPTQDCRHPYRRDRDCEPDPSLLLGQTHELRLNKQLFHHHPVCDRHHQGGLPRPARLAIPQLERVLTSPCCITTHPVPGPNGKKKRELPVWKFTGDPCQTPEIENTQRPSYTRNSRSLLQSVSPPQIHPLK
jgi:hypothetical protein